MPQAVVKKAAKKRSGPRIAEAQRLAHRIAVNEVEIVMQNDLPQGTVVRVGSSPVPESWCYPSSAGRG